MTITTGLLLSSSVMANTVTLHRGAKAIYDDDTTKTEALNTGYEIVGNLSTISKSELRKELAVFSSEITRHLSVKTTDIQTEKFAVNRNKVTYSAIVNLNNNVETREH